MKLIVANWKMNIGIRESVALARGVLLALRGKRVVPQVVLCPAFAALSEVHKALSHSRIALGAQNVFWEDAGAFTGEMSARMLTEAGCSFVLVGHSERRQFLQETDDMVHDKLAAAFRHKLTPVLCVGETSEQRRRGEAESAIAEQIRAALRGLKPSSAGLAVAYEPVWTVGTGEPARPEDVVGMHEAIRRILAQQLPNAAARSVRILYGGSVDGKNAYPFLREPAIDGLLVGGASLKIGQFTEILRAASDVMESQLT